ncbi:putative acetylxylan esterase 2 precursor [Xylariaceae sp. FL0255]|nr:putative acetylxylan esterase 2 precursor [Xylariaceae sp. FL0255]
MRSAACLLGAAALAAAAPLSTLDNRTTCYEGLYIIAARGSDEPAGEGDIQEVSDLITAAVPNSASVPVVYPATIFTDGTYPTSVSDGVNNLISLYTSYVDACGSSSKIALLGYSQGGNVVTDALAGGVDKPTPLSAAYTQYLTAVAVFGDPTFTVGESFDVGNATKSGIFARGGSSLAMLETYAPKIQSYCMVHDPVCAFGDDLDVHYAEVSTFAQSAANFVISKA